MNIWIYKFHIFDKAKRLFWSSFKNTVLFEYQMFLLLVRAFWKCEYLYMIAAVHSFLIKVCSEIIWKIRRSISSPGLNFWKVRERERERESNLQKLYSIINVLLECFENSLINIVDYLLGAASLCLSEMVFLVELVPWVWKSIR